ncbi:MAG: choice-of-anchor D domain-containing protein [Wenzhouxiangella sp.]|nr:MAG: choice-of-anchor D domain-containing protein [Wenzhouxiangella sp.]
MGKTMSRTIVHFGLLVILLALSAFASAQVAFTAARGASSVEPVTISNLGDAGSNLEVDSIEIDDDTHFLLEPGGSCIAPPFSLGGGDSCTQLVRFSPQAIGTFTATLTVLSDAPSVANDQVALSGTAEPGPEPALQVAPGSLSFGLVSADALPLDADVTVSNLGEASTELTVTSVGTSGDAEFFIQSDSCQGEVLAGGTSCTVTIRFDAASDGSFTGALQIVTSVGDATVPLSGATQIPARLVFLDQPVDTAVGDMITPPVVVEVQDASGDRVSLDNSTLVELALAVDPSGAASLNGTTATVVSNGLATFADLSLDQVGEGFVLRAADGAGELAIDDSAPFAILPGPPATLAFAVQPVDTVVGGLISPPVLVHVLDSFGNVVTWDSATEVGLALSGGQPSAQLGGGEVQQVSGGSVSFAGLSVDLAGTDYQLLAQSSDSAIASAASAAFDITSAGSGTTITGIDPAGSQVVGEPFLVSVNVTGVSPSGTVTVSDGSTSCPIDLDQGETACELVSTSAGPRTISANYPGDVNNAPSQAQVEYQITLASTDLAIASIDPAGSQAVNQAYTVEISTAGFNPGGTVTISDGQGASCLIVLGSANSCDLTSTSVGPRTISADYPGDANNQPASATAPYQIVAGAPDRVVFLVQPEDAVSAQAISPAVELQIQDAFGNPVLSDSSSEVALSLIDGTSGAELAGGDAIAVSAAVAVFDALSIDLAGSEYRLRADSADLPSAFSEPFDVSPGEPFELRFGVQPSSVLPGSPITPAVTITVRDAAGNLVISDNSTAVDLQLVDGTPGAVLANGGVITVSNGVATYAGLSVDQVGAGYRLSADDALGGLAGALSQPFNVVTSESETEIIGFDPTGAQIVGQPYDVLVEVTGASPTGLVTVSDDLGASCQFDVASDDRCSLVSTATGNRIITASYPGDTNNAASSDQTFYVINPAQSALSIVDISPAGQQAINQSYQVQIAVDGFNPTGPVIVDDGDGNVCVINLPADRCALTSTSVGPKTITASYGGNANNLGDTASQAYDIVRAQSTTSILGLTPAAQQVVELPYTVTVIVAGQNPSGQISVSDGQGADCLVDLDLGQTACELVSTSLGPRTILAEYSGDDNNEPSQASAPYQIVSTGPVALAFSVQPEYGVVNGPLFPRLVVRVVDSLGLLVADDDSTEIEIRIETNPGGGQLTGTPVKTVSGGVASFENLSISALGEGYQLRARTPNINLESAVTDFFDVIEDQVFGDRFELPPDTLFQDRFEVLPVPNSSKRAGSGLE